VVTHYSEKVKHLATATEKEQYYCKAISNETIKINDHITILSEIKQTAPQKKIVHHTHQVREQRAYRVVIRNLHHSVTTDEIKEELEKNAILPATY
jgi:hypothetical protein